MPELVTRFGEGGVTSRDPAALDPGELVSSVGAEYRPGDRERVWKVRGRAVFGTPSSGNAVRAVELIKFDQAARDSILALVGTQLLGTTAGLEEGSWVVLASGKNINTEVHLSAAHYFDRWYVVTGRDTNRVIEWDETAGDLTSRAMGMQSPQQPPEVATASTVGINVKPGASEVANDGFGAYDKARDGSPIGTFAYGQLSVVGDTASATWGGFASGTEAGRRVFVRAFVAGSQLQSPGGEYEFVPGSGDESGTLFETTTLIEYSEDGGSTWAELVQFRSLRAWDTHLEFSSPVLTANSDQVQVKATYTYDDGTVVSTLRIYDIRIQNAGGTTFGDTPGVQWVVTEYDQETGRESAPSAPSAAVNMNGLTVATLTIPIPVNGAVTSHFRVYRVPTGGSVPTQLGRVGQIPANTSATTEFVDTFEQWSVNDQPLPIVPLVIVSAGNSNDTGVPLAELAFPRDTAPPLMTYLANFQGSLVGIRGRSLFYSASGRPESWPEINVIAAFPIPERDSLVACHQLGSALWIGATEAILMLDRLPRVDFGQLLASAPRPLSGAPGLVGPKAFTVMSLDAEPVMAWVSPFGVYLTNGSTFRRISDDMDWEGTVSVANLSKSVLGWDANRGVLIFGYDSSGAGHPDRWALFHMRPEHRKSTGMPKITLGHYGKIGDLAAGTVGGVQRVYSAHPTDGKIYIEDYGTADASSSYSGTTVPMILEIPWLYAPDRQRLCVLKGSLRHTDGGATTVDVTIQTRRDSSEQLQSVTKTIDVSGHRGTEFFVNRSGERIRMTLQHLGAARFALLDARLDLMQAGKAGTVSAMNEGAVREDTGPEAARVIRDLHADIEELKSIVSKLRLQVAELEKLHA